MARRVTVPLLTASFVVALAAVATDVGVAPVRADPHPVPDPTCVSGLVWRGAYDGDAVCVRPADRDRTAQENALAASRRDPNGAYGPLSCKQGFVWREAYRSDTVCVSPDTRRENKDWNAYNCGTVENTQHHAGYCLPFPPPPRDLG